MIVWWRIKTQCESQPLSTAALPSHFLAGHLGPWGPCGFDFRVNYMVTFTTCFGDLIKSSDSWVTGFCPHWADVPELRLEFTNLVVVIVLLEEANLDFLHDCCWQILTLTFCGFSVPITLTLPFTSCLKRKTFSPCVNWHCAIFISQNKFSIISPCYLLQTLLKVKQTS